MISLDEANTYDSQDPLVGFADRFHHPTGPDGRRGVYLVGNSLGLQPRAARDDVIETLDRWASLAVEGHFCDDDGWCRYGDTLRPSLARLVGASEDEVACTSTLTANLHTLLASFYRPEGERTKLLIEQSSFPSDRYAAASQVAWHGLDPAEHLVEVAPGPDGLYGDALADAVRNHGASIATVLLGGVNYLTGELLDLRGIVEAAHEVGAFAGFDLAHAVGNVPIHLDDIRADFAAWCSYKYLNGGPGAVGGLYVARRHAASERLRLAGWWGNDPATRFSMTERSFVPTPTAQSWEVSNPPILSMAPLRASLAIFDEVGIGAVRRKSRALTAMLADHLSEIGGVRVLTPTDPERRGAQLSLDCGPRAETIREQLAFAGVRTDFRDPGVIRVSPAPLYNSFADVLRFAEGLQALMS